LEKGRKTLDNGDTPGSTGTLAVSRSEREASRTEQWECSKNEHCEKGKNSLQLEVENTDLRKEEQAVHQ
jgi:hypothetical protein